MIEINITNFEKDNEKYLLFKYTSYKHIKMCAYKKDDTEKIIEDYKEISDYSGISRLETVILISKPENPLTKECTANELISIKKLFENVRPYKKIIYKSKNDRT